MQLKSGKPAPRRLLFRMVIPAYPAFNIYSRIAKVTTSLGPVCVATAAHELPGWDVEIVDENNYRRYGPRDQAGMPDHDALQKARPADVVGLYGGLTSTIPRLYQIALTYKKYGITVLAGGQHFVGENVAHALRNGVDVISIGEGEETIRDLLLAVQNNRNFDAIRGIAFLKDGKPVETEERALILDHEHMPLPDFSLLRYACVRVYPVNWVRGCGMNCEFCTVKNKPRACSVERVFRHIAEVVEKYHSRHFFIVDDLFGQFRSETIRLCGLLEEYQKQVRIRLDITVQIRLDKANDDELLQAMRRAGVTVVCIGFESPIEEELLAMNKRLKPDDMIEFVRIYRRAGFHVHGMFIFGYPMPEGVEFSMPTEERVNRFKQFIRKGRIDTLQVLLPVPLPGTEMTERLKKQGRVYAAEHVGWEYYDGNFPLFQPDPPVTPEEMQLAARRIMGRFYQFKHMFGIGLYVLFFPWVVFYLHNIKAGFRKWYHYWRNSILRFGGWITIRNWTREFNKGVFTAKLEGAKAHITTQVEHPKSDAAKEPAPPAGKPGSCG